MREFLRDLPRRIGYGPGPKLMSELRKRWVLFRHPHADVRFDGPVYLGPGFSPHIPTAGTFHVGPGVEFRRGFRAEIAGDGRVTIGAGTVFTYEVVIQCSTSIDIGERVMFAQGALVVDGNHRFRDLEAPTIAQGYDFRPIRIGDDAAIMSKCTVIADVGERTFVGANSVVTKDLPPYVAAAGVPARIVDELRGPAEQGDVG